jgi:hypothetical protein
MELVRWSGRKKLSIANFKFQIANCKMNEEKLAGKGKEEIACGFV